MNEVALFAYGTLMLPEVMHALVGRRVDGVSAILNGYIRRRIRGESFPGIVQGEGSVTGIVYAGIDVEELERLDDFESDFYDRVDLSDAISADCAAPVLGYVVAPRYRELMSNEDWDLEHFRRVHLQRYVSGIADGSL